MISRPYHYIADYHDVFVVYDTKDDGVVPFNKIKDIVKLLGMEPESDMMEDLLKRLHKNGKYHINISKLGAKQYRICKKSLRYM